MKTLLASLGVIILIALVLVAIFAGTIIASLNREAGLRAAISAEQTTIELSYDTMQKVILQKVQLPAAAKRDLLQLLPALVEGRKGGESIKAVGENYPQMTLSLYEDISRSIESERHTLLNSQKKLLDLSREHNQLLNSVVSGTVCSIFGRRPIEVHTISSTKAKDAIQSGVDDDTKLEL